ncbi:MAG: type I-U CRISPR-associated protein Csb2 [Acidobacteriota bacterium]
MPLLIAQQFPLGRFHATRWNQNPFEDPHGEWPPSPWRFLRALAARWFQYSRETGDADSARRDELLKALAREVPAFQIPDVTSRGPAIRQYHPTGLERRYKYKKDPRTNRKVLDYNLRQTVKTLVRDDARLLPTDQEIIWAWQSVHLAEPLLDLLLQLLRRMIYFGRAESFCRFHVLDQPPENLGTNCHLTDRACGGVPVLVAKPNVELRLDALLAATSDKMSERAIPQGTAWYYAKLPPRPGHAVAMTPEPTAGAASVSILQFAVGGRVYPPLSKWIRLTERFRGRVLRIRAQQLTGVSSAGYADLSDTQRHELRLISGKDCRGAAIAGHEHAFFLLWPDASGLPTRLICWRKTPFLQDELEALLAASEYPFSWGFGNSDWQVRMVPLPNETPAPRGLYAEAKTWVGATPYVPPGNRRRFRKNGRIRSGETPDRLLQKLLVASGFPEPGEITAVQPKSQPNWVHVHETRRERSSRGLHRTTTALPGFYFRIVFPEPVRGPICLGHSSHFGLGLFIPGA